MVKEIAAVSKSKGATSFHGDVPSHLLHPLLGRVPTLEMNVWASGVLAYQSALQTKETGPLRARGPQSTPLR